MISFKILKASRSILVHRSVLSYAKDISKQCFINVSHKNSIISAKNMSQTSIRSFFTTTPRKTVEIEHVKEKKDDSVEENDSPQTNGNEKKSKRVRSDSSDKESVDHNKSSTPDSLEKKKPKRRRIVSSGSESDSKSDKEEIKLEKESKPPKTYDSPKSRKVKAKTVKVEKSPIKSSPKSSPEKQSPFDKIKSPKIKQEKVSPKPKKEVKSPSVTKRDNKKSESPQENKENGVKNEKEEDSKKNTIVAEEDYNPAKSKYHPINDACWSKGKEVPYLALAKTLEAIEATSARLKIIEILSNYLRSVMLLTPEDLLPSIYMCLNQLAPAYHSLELGMAETYIMKAVGQCTGRSLAQMKAAARTTGDLGLVAEQARATQRTMFKPAPLMLRKVFNSLKEVALETGQASVNKKIGKIQSLYVACRHSEARYLIRSLEGKLRVGLAEQSVLQALAVACASSPPAGPGAGTIDMASTMSADEFKARVDSFALTIKSTYCECPNYELVLAALLARGVAALPERCRLTPGIPLKPMLAHPTRAVADLFTRFEKEQVRCEWKYDGERAQIHVLPDGPPAIFSRNQEDNTSKYPDVLGRLPALLKESVTSCVLDCEAVAYDTENKQILPFQVLSTRKRKGAREEDIKVQVCVFVFDLLLLNGDALVRRPLAERRALLLEHFREVEGQWQFAKGRDCSSAEEVEQELGESLRGSCEGLMVKALTGPHSRYDIARRSHNWLKLKKDYLEGCGDSIDAVVIGAFRGKGKRAGLLGGFLLAARDSDADVYQSLCKIGTGFSDDELKTFTESLQEHIIDAPPNYYMYSASVAPDVWVAAALVWEVRCADLSLSPAHRAAYGALERDRGVSLRFPRFVRVRDDKRPEHATSAQQLVRMYLAQDQVRNCARAPAPDDDFY